MQWGNVIILKLVTTTGGLGVRPMINIFVWPVMRPEAVFQNVTICNKILISGICGKIKVKTISELWKIQFCHSILVKAVQT